MIRWHGFCAHFFLLCVCVFFCLLFLSNCLLHYLTNPMIIIYFVCLSCFLLFCFPLLTFSFPTRTHPHFSTFARVRLASIKYSSTINDVFCLLNYCFLICFCAFVYSFVCFAGCNIKKHLPLVRPSFLLPSWLALLSILCLPVCVYVLLWKITIISFHCL